VEAPPVVLVFATENGAALRMRYFKIRTFMFVVV